MKDERVCYVVMGMETSISSMPLAPDKATPIGFLPVFSTEEAAKAYAGDRFTITAVRLRSVSPGRPTEEKP